MNDSIIHTLQNYSWSKQFLSEVIKWFNAENATSLSFSLIEKCLAGNFTLLFAKYYLYNTKLTHGGISMSAFIAKVIKIGSQGLHVATSVRRK